MVAKIQFRRDTAANWTSANTILSAGELGYETNTNKAKIGDGSTAWNSLDYTVYDPDFADVTNKPTTLAGYGITDAVQSPLSFASIANKPTTLAGYGITDAITSVAFADLTNKPTTLAGFGITDAFNGQFGALANKPTTLAGYGISDAFSGAFSALTGKPTTISGYGITDAFSGSFADLTNRPTTLAGYGITDSFNGQFSQLAGTPTTLAGYGISDAFDGEFTSLANKPTSLSGYGITDNIALLNNPTFTGTPTAPTASSGTNTTQIATTAYVQGSISTFSALSANALIYFSDNAPTTLELGQIWQETDTGALYKCVAGTSVVPLDSSLVTASSSNVTVPAAGASDTRLVLATGLPSGSISLDPPVFIESFTSTGSNDPELTSVTYADNTNANVNSNNIQRASGNALDTKVKSFSYTSTGTNNTSQSFMTITISGKPEWQVQESHVQAKVDAIIDSAPGALNTLNELAAALGDDANFSTTVTNSIATKAPLASPALTGTPTAPTAAANTNTTQIATTAYVQNEIGTPFVKTDLSASNSSFPSGGGTLGYNSTTGVFTFTPPDLSSFLTTVSFANLTGKPTTISGYGITDAFDGAFSSLTGLPTTVAGYGITDAFDGAFSSLSGKPTTISGYGITDAFDGAFSSLTGRPSTISGYGITDALALGTTATTALAGNTTFSFAQITSKPTTIAGYGITDAFDGAYNSLSGIPTTIAHKNADIDIGSNDFITTGKVLFANVYSALSDLPSASTYHGMFAHVHATGAAYFAHGGNWIRLANNSDIFSGAFSSLTGKPTTLAGYGITDAAALASPAFTGAPTAPTAASGTNTTQIATTAFVTTAVSSASGTYTNTSVDAHLNTGTANTNEVLSWNGSDYDWVAQTGGGGGASVSVSETAPSSPSQGDLWFDPSVLKTFVYYNDGTANQWVQSNPTGSGGGGGGGGASVSTSDTAPSSPSDGDLWYNTSTSGLFVYYQDADSSQWVEVVGSSGADGADGASTPARVTTSDSAPSSPTAGDLWYDTDDGGLFVYYADGSSSQWVEIVGPAGADGTGVGSFVEKTSSYTAVAGDKLIVDTSNAVTITLPASATIGDEIRIIDGTGNANTNNITIARNGHKIQGATSDLTVGTERAAFGLVYYNTAQGWLLTER